MRKARRKFAQTQRFRLTTMTVDDVVLMVEVVTSLDSLAERLGLGREYLRQEISRGAGEILREAVERGSVRKLLVTRLDKLGADRAID